jgi:tRNA dimethylallyltransferase
VRQAIADWECQDGAAALAQHLRNTDPALAATLDLQNPVRVRRALEKMRAKTQPTPVRIPPYLQVKTALSPDPTALDAAIGQRVREMMDSGWEEEVRGLMRSGVPFDAPGLRAIGYRRLWEAIEARNSCEDVVEAIARDTRRYAKRQRTWLRSEPRLKTIEEPDPCVRLARVMDWIREYARS